MNDAQVLFREALQEVYGALQWLPTADGEVHRFHVPGDKAGSQNGWYVLYPDGIASGAFGSWKAGQACTWCSRKPVDTREAFHLHERIEQARRQREAEQLRRQRNAADIAQRWWRDARRADPAHPYLVAKRARAYSLRQRGGDLLVPLYIDGQLVNLQRISSDGAKRFLYGGRIKGVYSPVGNITPGTEICVCEGWATAASLHEHTGHTVAAAMNAGNLLPAALGLRARYPDHSFLIAGDDDRLTDGNPGRRAANSAAVAVGAQVTFPDWPEGCPDDLTDFNDLACWNLDHADA